MSGHQLAYTAIERLIAGYIAKGQVLGKGGAIQFWSSIRMLEEYLDFRAEQKLVCRFGVVQGLDPEPVARNEQRLALAVPNGEREHPAQVLDRIFPVLLVKMNDGFGVALRTIGVARGDQGLAQRGMV